MPGRWSPGCTCCAQAIYCSCNACADVSGETTGVNNAPCCIKVEISGVIKSTDGAQGGDWACCECTDANGTYYALQDSTGACTWTAEMCSASQPYESCGAARIFISIFQSSGDWIVRARIATPTTLMYGHSLGTATVAHFEKNYGTSKPDCKAFSSTALPFVEEADYLAKTSGPFGTRFFDVCDWTGATLKITGLNNFTGCLSAANTGCGLCDVTPSVVDVSFSGVLVDDPCEEGETTCCDTCSSYFVGKTFTLPKGTGSFGTCCFTLGPALGSAGRTKFLDGQAALCATDCESTSDDMCLNWIRVCMTTPFFGTNFDVSVEIGRQNEFSGVSIFAKWTKTICDPCSDPYDCSGLSTTFTAAHLTDYGLTKDYCDWSATTVSITAKPGSKPCIIHPVECIACLCGGTTASGETPDSIEAVIPAILGAPYDTDCCDDPLGITCPDSSSPDANAITCCTAAVGTFCLNYLNTCTWRYNFDPNTQCPNHDGSSCSGWSYLEFRIINGESGLGKPNKFELRLTLASATYSIIWKTDVDMIGSPVPTIPAPGRPQVIDCLAPLGSSTVSMGEDGISSSGAASPCSGDGTTKITIDINAC